MLGKDPNNVLLQCNKPLLSAIRDCRHLLEMSTKNTAPCKEIVTGWPHYIGVKDASSHRIGGIIMGEGKSCREGEHRKKGISFEEFRTYLEKLRYAFITIPSGKGLLSLCNQMLGKEPKNILLQCNKPLLSAIRDCRHLLEMSTKNPTPCK